MSSNDHYPMRSVSLGGERSRWTGSGTGSGALPPLTIADIAKMVTSIVIDGAPNASALLPGQRDSLPTQIQVSLFTPSND